MKKSIIFTIPCLIFFSSCSNESENEKILSYFHEDLTSFVYTNDQELKLLSTNKEDFILFVFSDCGCGGHTDSVFTTMQKYISETHRLIYAIGDTDYKQLPISLSETFPLYPQNATEEIETMPALYFYKNGQRIFSQNYNESMLQLDTLSTIIENKTTPHGLYLLNDLDSYTYKGYDFFKIKENSTSLLDEKISQNECSILYSWKSCGDCYSLKQILSSYYLEQQTKLYFFEVNYYRNGENKATLWDNGFPVKYQFSDYRGGKVPSIVHYKDSQRISFLVYHNDVVTDGIVTESFFEELIGSQKTEEEREQYHQEKVVEYLKDLENK